RAFLPGVLLSMMRLGAFAGAPWLAPSPEPYGQEPVLPVAIPVDQLGFPPPPQAFAGSQTFLTEDAAIALGTGSPRSGIIGVLPFPSQNESWGGPFRVKLRFAVTIGDLQAPSVEEGGPTFSFQVTQASDFGL
ncbi:MAG: hypothetical protein GY915_01210, partial [bacterium]|nr:hypothetical protein [bacterium]